MTDPRILINDRTGALRTLAPSSFLRPVRPRSRCLMRRQGLWTVGADTNAEKDPEAVSAFYRARVDISYVASTGTAPIAGNTVTGSTLAWTAKVVSVNVGAKTAQLDVLSGAAAGVGAEVLTGPAGTWTGVNITGTGLGTVSGFADTSGKRAPWSRANNSRIFNCLGSRADGSGSFFTPVNRVPLRPESYNRTFQIPRGGLKDGEKIVVEAGGVYGSSTGDQPQVLVAANVSTPIFELADLGADGPERMLVVSPNLVPTFTEEAFGMRVTFTSIRDTSRKQGLLMAVEFHSVHWSWGGAVEATGFDFTDLTKRNNRDVGLWLAVSPTGPDDDFHLNVHTVRADLVRGEQIQ